MRAYAIKRIVRLIPLLWAVVIGWSVLRWLGGDAPSAITIVRSLFLWPSLEPTVPIVVWALRHEALFYLAFTALLFDRLLGVIVFAGWALASIGQAIAVLAGTAIGGWPALLLSPYTLDFLMGMGVAVAFAPGLVRPGWVVLAGALAVVAALLAIEEMAGIGRAGTADYVSVAATWWTPVLGMAFAGALWGLLAIEPLVRVRPWGMLLGAASYAIYLVHTPVNALAQRIAIYLPDAVLALGGGQLLLIAAGVAGGVLVHLGVERPVTRALRRRLLPQGARQTEPRA